MAADERAGEGAAGVGGDDVDDLLEGGEDVGSEGGEVRHYGCIKAAGAQGVTGCADHCGRLWRCHHGVSVVAAAVGVAVDSSIPPRQF